MRPSALGISGLLCHRVLKKPLYLFDRASLVAQVVKNLPAVQETWIQFLGLGQSPGNGMANHSSILAWRIPWTEEPSRTRSPVCGVAKSWRRLSD